MQAGADVSDSIDRATDRLPPAALMVTALRDVRDEVKALRAELTEERQRAAEARAALAAHLAGQSAIAALLSPREKAAVAAIILALLSGLSLADVARAALTIVAPGVRVTDAP